MTDIRGAGVTQPNGEWGVEGGGEKGEEEFVEERSMIEPTLRNYFLLLRLMWRGHSGISPTRGAGGSNK